MSQPIDRNSLGIYLNDHLAASVAALELIGRMEKAHAESPLGNWMASLRETLEQEQAVVCALIDSIGATESPVRKAVAWLGEKVARLKVGPGTDDASGLMLFEALEALSLGFWGRGALWRTLTHVGIQAPAGTEADFPALARRAEQQLAAMDHLRLEASMTALREQTAVA
jgi:hypothetical protein